MPYCSQGVWECFFKVLFISKHIKMRSNNAFQQVTETRIISSLRLQYLDTLSVLVSDINTELNGILKAEAAT